MYKINIKNLFIKRIVEMFNEFVNTYSLKKPFTLFTDKGTFIKFSEGYNLRDLDNESQISELEKFNFKSYMFLKENKYILSHFNDHQLHYILRNIEDDIDYKTEYKEGESSLDELIRMISERDYLTVDNINRVSVDVILNDDYLYITSEDLEDLDNYFTLLFSDMKVSIKDALYYKYNVIFDEDLEKEFNKHD